MPQNIANRLLNPNVNNIVTNIGNWGNTPIAPREKFFKFLNKWETSIPLQSLWMVFFDIPILNNRPDGSFRTMDQQMKGWGEYVLGQPNHWSSDKAYEHLWKEENKGHQSGITFATSINIPGESSEIRSIGFNNRGFLRDPIMQARTPLQPVSINFLETNLSFVDHIIRPWLILSTHMGFCARPENTLALGGHDRGGAAYGGLSTTMTVIQFAKMGYDTRGNPVYGRNMQNEIGMEPRKVFVFKDAIPVKVDNQDMAYGIDNDLQKRAVEFQYRRYQVFSPEEVMKDGQSYDNKDIHQAEPREHEEQHALDGTITAANAKIKHGLPGNPGRRDYYQKRRQQELDKDKNKEYRAEIESYKEQTGDIWAAPETMPYASKAPLSEKTGGGTSKQSLGYLRSVKAGLLADEAESRPANRNSYGKNAGLSNPKGNQVHKGIYDLPVLNEGPGPGSAAQDRYKALATKTNMKNKKPPKKVKGGSGIFGLLGF